MAGALHVPVLLREVLHFLAPRPGGRYLDGTVGLGGHSMALLEAVEGRAELIGLDRDPEALALARERLAGFPGVRLHNLRYSRFSEAVAAEGWDGLDGALLDLGVSSLQLDDADRGFSFLSDGPLDMRMGAADGVAPASSLVNRASFERLRELIGRLGEEPLCGRIARFIVQEREKQPFETTRQLAECVERAYPAKMRATARRHPATRTFQALRMAVNQELEELESFLADIVDHLRPGGRLAVISFHSLEDRLVKRAFRDEEKGCLCPPRQPVCTCGRVARLKVLTRKPVVPDEDECQANPRSRSAKLRAAERVAAEARR
ncbi:MAG: 16S rRNA (cytosine(1402)-N(4))-methyltransferase RsmH [Thermodesulfobacteriota bacterium]